MGEYILALTINDGVSESAEDHIVVTVQIADLAPTADCGGTYYGDIGQIVNLDGTASFDPEDGDLEYSWSLFTPACSMMGDTPLMNQTTSDAAFVPDCEGVYMATLMVSDGNQWSEPAICTIDVASANQCQSRMRVMTVYTVVVHQRSFRSMVLGVTILTVTC